MTSSSSGVNPSSDYFTSIMSVDTIVPESHPVQEDINSLIKGVIKLLRETMGGIPTTEEDALWEQRKTKLAQIHTDNLSSRIKKLLPEELTKDEVLEEIRKWEKTPQALISHPSPIEGYLLSYNLEQVRLGTDTGLTKLSRLLEDLQNPLNQNSLRWDKYSAASLKTCTSVLRPNDITYCKNLGVFIYLCTDDPNALLAAAAHDILSPSESLGLKSSKVAVAQYAINQEIFKTLALLTRYFLTLLSPNESKEIGKTISTFDKKYYCSSVEAPKLTVQIQLETIQKWLNDNDIPSCMDISIEDVNSLVRAANNFFNHSIFFKNGIQRADTTGWELHEGKTDHILHYLQRLRYGNIYSSIKSAGINSEEIDKKKMMDLLNKPEGLFKNIVTHVNEDYCVKDALLVLEEKIRNYRDFLDKINDLELVERADGLTMLERRNQLEGFLKEEIEYSKGIYTEIQFYSEKLFIKGIGIKKYILDLMKESALSLMQPYYIKSKGPLERLEKEVKDLTEKKTSLEKQIKEVEKDLDAPQTLDLQEQLTEVKTQIKDLETEQQEQKAKAFADYQQAASDKLQSQPKNFDELKCTILTYEIMKAARARGIPLFVHFGDQPIDNP